MSNDYVLKNEKTQVANNSYYSSKSGYNVINSGSDALLQNLVNQLSIIPEGWVLTPVIDKASKRDGWQYETPLTRTELVSELKDGHKTKYDKIIVWNGYGLRTGEVSGGLLAVDVDGPSAVILLKALESTYGLFPNSVAWTSGKEGRKQLLFQIPDHYRDRFESFGSKAITEFFFNGNIIKTVLDASTKKREELDFRYNGHQSVLPPSKHPETGQYYWINSPKSTPVAILPDAYCDFILSLLDDKKTHKKPTNQKESTKTKKISSDFRGVGFGFNILDYIDILNPAKEKNKYFCPVCDGHNLSVNRFSGAYQCFNGCDNKDIREAIAPRPNRDEFKTDEFDRKITQKRLENERKRERELKLKTEKLFKSLNPIDRDTEHRKILSQLTLSDEHRDYLVNRLGFPLEALERCRTVERKQRLTYQINKHLAGVHPISGMSLTNGEKGILVTFPDANGYLVGMKLYNPTGESKSKWFSSDWFDIGSSPKFSNGEPPIAVYYPEIITDLTKIGLCEGVEWKANEAANRLGYPVIGFSGIPFLTLSPETTKAAITIIQAKTGINDVELIFIPDGGLVQKSENIKPVQKFIKNTTHKCTVAWWEQFYKSDGDIDEINQYKINSIVYLDPQTFFEIANKEQWRKKVGEEQKKLNNLSYKPDILIDERYFPSLAELNEIKALPNTGILNLVGHKGSGKSTLTKQIKNYYRSKGYEVISITPRIALGREQAVKWDIEWISNIEPHYFIEQNTAQLGLCFDSIHRIADRDFTQKTLLIFDESELGFNHLITSNTLKDRRSFILKTLENIIKDCLNNNGLIILSDADLTDVSVDYVKSFCPETPIFTVINEAKPQSWEIDFFTGGHTGADVKRAIFDDVENGLRLIIPIDNQGEAQALERELCKRFPDKKIIRIDRTTTETEAGRKFVEQINLSILNEKPHVLIHTGSMGTGCSIDGEHYDKKTKETRYFDEVYNCFDKVYGLFFGVIEPSQCRQYLARYRKPVPRIIWAKESGFKDDSCKSFLPDVIKRNLFKNSEQTLNIIELAKELAGGDNADDIAVFDTLNGMMNRESGTWDNPHIDLYCKIKARLNYGLNQLAVQLRQELIEEGHTLTDYSSESSNTISDAIKANKQEIKIEQATAIATATDIPLEEAKKISSQMNTTEDERNQLTKALLKSELPGLELTPDFILDWILKDRRKSLNAVKLFFFCQNPDIAKRIDTKTWKAKLSEFTNGSTFLPDIKTYSPMVKVLQDLEYFNLIDLNNCDREYMGTDMDMGDFMKRAYSMRNKIHTAFGLTVTKKTDPMKFIGHLSQRIGISFLLNGKFKINGKTVRSYKIDQDPLKEPCRKMILESLHKRYAENLTG